MALKTTAVIGGDIFWGVVSYAYMSPDVWGSSNIFTAVAILLPVAFAGYEAWT